jgi:regulatory protein
MSFARKSRKPQEPLTEAALYDYAVAALGRRMRTVAELKRLMRTRVEPDETGHAKMDTVVARLKEYKFLNDSAYAADYTRMRQENEKFGKRRVQQELYKKGVHSEVIAKTLDTAYEHVSEEELARRHLERKRIHQPTTDKEAARVMRQLVRAGFSPGVIFKILKNWQIDEEALAALDAPDGPGEAE